MPANNNMKLWNAVCETDPEHTKRVNQRGGFTAIDAMYQVQNATEQFGPVGVGWGWDFVLNYWGEMVVAEVTLWHGKPEQTVKQVGQKAMVSNGRMDEDAAKKAVTDGLTKCLSYLGFNADVFLGKFDDNKYVAEMTKKHQDETEKKESAKKADERAGKAKEFANGVAGDLESANEFGGKVAVLTRGSKMIVKLSQYPDAQEIAVDAVRKFCFSQYGQMLNSLKSRDALLDMLGSWDQFRKIVTGLDTKLGDELAAMEDEIASKFPAAEAAE